MMSGDRAGGPPERSQTWWRMVGILLMLPIGLIIALMLVNFIGGGKG